MSVSHLVNPSILMKSINQYFLITVPDVGIFDARLDHPTSLNPVTRICATESIHTFHSLSFVCIQKPSSGVQGNKVSVSGLFKRA